MDELSDSLRQYEQQLSMVNTAITETKDDTERESLLSLQTDLNHLIELTKESLDTVSSQKSSSDVNIKPFSNSIESKSELDDEYALFMQEMSKSGAYDEEGESSNIQEENGTESDIEDELASLLGMKCGVYHTHKWGGQPTLHNAMVSEVIPRQGDDKFSDLQVRVLFTHPTHAEMVPCPFYLNGDCKFDDDTCRYSHGAVVQLSNLKEAIDPNFDLIKASSRVLLKLKPPDGEEINLTKKSAEKYYLWHRAIVKNVDLEKRMCTAKLEHGLKTGEKRKSGSDEYHVHYEDVFPLNTEQDNSESDSDSISDTKYPESKTGRGAYNENEDKQALLVEKSFLHTGPAMGEWERHTRGIGSKIMLAMGYVPGCGLGADGDGRVQPVEARVLPVGKSLDHCMKITERAAGQDPLKIEQRIKRLQKKEQERNKRAYEREKEKEKRNVFNFINKTLGGNVDASLGGTTVNIKDSTSKDLNIEQFKITEDSRRIEKEITKLNSSIIKYPDGTPGHRSLCLQIAEKNKVLNQLRNREQQISTEQKKRKGEQKMAVF